MYWQHAIRIDKYGTYWQSNSDETIYEMFKTINSLFGSTI